MWFLFCGHNVSYWFRYTFTKHKWDSAFVQVCVQNAIQKTSEIGEPLRRIGDYIKWGTGNLLLTDSTYSDHLRYLINDLIKESVEMDDQDSLKMILEWFTQYICKIEKIKKLVKGWKNERKSLGIKVQNLSSYQLVQEFLAIINIL